MQHYVQSEFSLSSLRQEANLRHFKCLNKKAVSNRIEIWKY